MPDSILDLPDEYKDQLIEALVRLRSLDGERVWVLNVRLIDGTVLSEDAVEYKGPFPEQGLNRIAPLLDRSGLVYADGPAWSSNNDETEVDSNVVSKGRLAQTQQGQLVTDDSPCSASYRVVR